MSHLRLVPLAVLVLAACSPEAEQPSDPTVPKGYTHVRLSLATAGMEATSRAWIDAAANDGEMMRKATVVVADQAGTVQLIRRIMPESGESERELIDLGTLPNGIYTFYNFGNLTDTYGESETTASFNNFTYAVGQSVPDGATDGTFTARFNRYNAARTGLPMTNIEQHTLDGGNATIALQLYRQMAKMRLVVSNNTQGDVRISRVTVGNITANDATLRFFPTKATTADGNEYAIIAWPDATAPETANFDYYTAPSADAPFAVAQGIEATMPDAYLNESETDHITHQVPIAIEMQRLTDDGTWDAEVRHALMNVSAMPRNALIRVPVNLLDYMLELEAFFYPPIGGYPPFSMVKKNEEYYATFHGSGDFQLIPHLYAWTDHDDPTKWFSLNDATVVVHTDGQQPSLTVRDPQGIFARAPYIDSVTGEILGTLSGNTGEATVSLTAYLRVNELETYRYNRTIYFIAE